ncbi:MAG: sulfatase [Planctomycetes bacterium]|nr:sulfatase [Planctomycetota bacterium]
MTGPRARAAAALLLLLAAAGGLWWISGRGGARPDIVLLLWDTTRADRLSAHGYGRRTTPWLEEVAAQGVLYEQCRAPSPWTVPSHASLFTGLLPRVHGAVDLRSPLAPTHRTLAERLREEGYDTVCVTNNPLVHPQTGLAQGFDTFVLVPDERGAQGGFLTRDILARLLAERRASPARAARPLFLFVNLMEPHLPYDPPEELERPWRPEGAGEREVREARGVRFPADMAHNLGLRPISPATLRILSSLYDAEIAEVDRASRAIAELLGREGVLSEEDGGWLLAVTADHGENIGEHGLVDHKLSVADTLLHVPLVIRSPGRFEGGLRIPGQVRLQDLFPTILRAAGVPFDAAGTPRAAPLPSAPGGERFQVAEFQAPLSFLEGMRPFFPGAPEEAFLPFRRGLVTAVGPLEGGRRLKWTRTTEQGGAGLPGGVREALHDLVADPFEARDLLAVPEPAAADREAAARLAAEAEAWLPPPR